MNFYMHFELDMLRAGRSFVSQQAVCLSPSKTKSRDSIFPGQTDRQLDIAVNNFWY